MEEDEQSINDAILLAAIRKRLLSEIESGGGDAERIVNNIYGGGMNQQAGPVGQSGIQEGLGEDFDYYVDINKTDRLGDDGSKEGWDKSVHRYRKKKMIP